ncbi:hypothetical protein K469DRAFT_701194 [Zopfia rhizophila CBS 207.26]|uniref:Uncharacterized protein n=1 Tax=Zopfia rhizophila CBS 207.26 TaxID=1314779 RepID=A0A6A6EIH2_9PEZI|nr:hypothetical protein K469DRAFT_701194 [Zopfia rhizophila CBS 207.26]
MNRKADITTTNLPRTIILGFLQSSVTRLTMFILFWTSTAYQCKLSSYSDCGKSFHIWQWLLYSTLACTIGCSSSHAADSKD